MKEFIEIPFGAKDSELCGWEYTIPEGYTVSIEDGKIIVKKEDTDDEDIKSCIAMCLTDANEQRFKDYGTNLKDCLAWLEKQGEQKSAWSKEDDSKIESICRLLKTRFDKDTCDEVGFTRDKMCDYLSSLKNKIQPQWKPSEEHIRYLQAVVNDAHNIGSESCCIALRDLLEQLKKL